MFAFEVLAMRWLVVALLSPCLAFTGLRAQTYDPQTTGEQQQALQSLLDNAIVAVRQKDQAAACNLRSQALTILNANVAAFQALYPANDWGDLQESLQGSMRKCAAQGLPAQGGG